MNNINPYNLVLMLNSNNEEDIILGISIFNECFKNKRRLDYGYILSNLNHNWDNHTFEIIDSNPLIKINKLLFNEIIMKYLRQSTFNLLINNIKIDLSKEISATILNFE